MSESKGEDTRKYTCRFPGLQGLDRILRAQAYSSGQSEDQFYSLPIPYADNASPHRGGTSCNIVIVGEPGTGKSTLALNMAGKLRIASWKEEEGATEAIENTEREEVATAIYFGLEQSRTSLIKRAKEMDEDERAIWLKGPEAGEASESLEGRIHTEEGDAKEQNCVLFPILSPRPLEQTDKDEGFYESEEGIFWKRHGEIKNLIREFRKMRKASPAIPALRMVVIDSLNVFGDRPITRYLLEQLFSLFSEEGLICIFIGEDPEQQRSAVAQEPLVSPGIENLADVVLKLGWERDEDYAFRSIEVVKSRATGNVSGVQQMKVWQNGVSIYPSLHSWYTYLRAGAENGKEAKDESQGDRLTWFKDRTGCKKEVVVESDQDLLLAPLVYLISGAKEKHKSQLALEYAAWKNGKTGEDGGTDGKAAPAEDDSVNGETAQQEDKRPKPGFLLVMFDESIVSIAEARSSHNFGSVDFLPADGGEEGPLHKECEGFIPSSKGRLAKICLRVGGKEKVFGYELWLAPGYLLSEEFVCYLHRILTSLDGDISRVIIRDIGELPMRHPVMARHILSGKSNFIPVLLELFRRLKKDCFFVCTTEDGDQDAEKIRRGLASAAHFNIDLKKGKLSGLLFEESKG